MEGFDILGPFLQYGAVLQVVAIVHFIQRRPDGYWLWIIIIGGGLGALAYFIAEVIPDAGLLRGTFQGFPRRKRIKELRTALLDNPSIANYEELGHLYLDDQQFAQARECFDRVISARTDSPDPFYRRALAAIALNDFHAAAADSSTWSSGTRSSTRGARRASTPTRSGKPARRRRPRRCSPT